MQPARKPISRTSLLLLTATHLLALGVAYTLARQDHPQPVQADDSKPARTKASNRSLRSRDEGDGALLLDSFRKEQSGNKSRYEELKASLPVAANVETAAMEAFAKWKRDSTELTFTELQVRLLHWLRQDPMAAAGFIGTESILDNGFTNGVVCEVVAGKGVIQSLPWLAKLPFKMTISATVEEMTAGAGFALVPKLEAAIRENSSTEVSIGPTYLGRIGKAVRFSEKDRLLEYARGLATPEQRHSLLFGFSQSGEQAADWVLGLVERGELDATLAASLKGSLGNEVLNTPAMDMDKRVAARRATKGNETKFRETIISEIVGGDVNHLLVNGRDWRYEFRNGVSSLDDVVKAVRSGLPGIPSEGEEAMQISLYRQLSEENPKKALPLLDGLSEEKRREVLFSNTWNSHGNNNPDDFVRFLNGLPEPLTQKEKDERIKGWDWKARGCLSRYGDDYVEWVKALPPGLDKERAMNSLVWATREQNPAKARELSDQLYSKKP